MTKILIVDDIPQNIYLLEVLLRSNGFEVETATNGIEALESAHKSPPDMIVSDILMPGMDGFSLCRAWMSDDRLKDIPFVFYTATYTDLRDEKLALSLGAERFLVKPMEPDVFLSNLRDIFEKQVTKQKDSQNKTLVKEEIFIKEYNEALIRKLEDKMVQLQRSNRHLASLYQASSDLHTTNSLDDLIQIILHTIVEIAGYQQANFFSFNENQQNLVLSAAIGFSKETLTVFKEKLVFNLGEKRGLVGLVALNQQTIIIPDTSKEPNWITLDQTIRSALLTPVHFGNTIRGVIALFSQELDSFTEEDENNIAILANNLAIAFENKKNQENVNKQLMRISALHNIDMAIKSTMDLHTCLDILLEHVTAELRCDAADILLFKSKAEVSELAVGRGFKAHKINNYNIPLDKSLANKVAVEQRTIHLFGLSDQLVSPEFAAVWAEERFATYLGAPLIAKGELVGVLEVYHRTNFDPNLEWMDYFETLAGQAAIAIHNAKMFNDLQHSNTEMSLAYDATIKGWSRAMDLRDHETEGHTQRVTEMTFRLAEIIGISEDQMVHIHRGALLHDIGKLGVPDSILLKPGTLSDEEMTIMKKHPQFAYDLLMPIDYLLPALDIPYCHHEKWDGTGYPRGLQGEAIPLAARLFAIVDVWDALRSDRVYRKAWPEEKVIEYIRDQSGKYFDPMVVEQFLRMLSVFD